jgi:uncharacterized RDD family membrane protein YckC
MPAQRLRQEPWRQPAPAPIHLPSQASLFRDASGPPKVIPIPTLTPVRPIDREISAQPRRAPRPPRAPRQAQRRANDSQQALDFHNPGVAETKVQAVIYCDAPVALPTHRLIAAAFDASMIILAVGAFLAVFLIAGGQIEFTRQNLGFLVGVITVVTMLYRWLWAVANGDSPGMRFAGLRLVDFDGRRPDRDQRGMRLLASLLSIVSVGLGLVWALVDEESLAWHDHISKTFPTAG